VTLLAASAVAVNADCGIHSFEEGGNWFCQAVNKIAYDSLNVAGSYKAVSHMDSNGACNFETKEYSGSIAPFDEELSVHIRGPTQLKTFAVYTPTKSKKREVPSSNAKRHGHQHLHKKHREARQQEKRDMVTATINGQVVSWVNTNGVSTQAATTAAVTTLTKQSTPDSVVSGNESVEEAPKGYETASSGSNSTDGGSSAVTGDYERIAFYEAESQTADGVAFLGNYGGQGSGVWDTTWGNSLSYTSEDATSGFASPTILKDCLVGDNVEYSIWTDKECAEEDASCGYYRPGTIAHHGFGGADKVFLFEFQMPMSGKKGFNADMPAIWLLNSKIPRTMQYGDCSCWGGIGEGGCGEFDIFEALASGDTKCKSTFHYTNSIGSSDYFERPINDYVKVAVVFQASTSTASIKVLPASTDFSTSLTTAQVEDMIKDDEEFGLSTLMSIVS
ncbi:TOS1 protein, partial [Pseudomassariella vexata]